MAASAIVSLLLIVLGILILLVGLVSEQIAALRFETHDSRR